MNMEEISVNSGSRWENNIINDPIEYEGGLTSFSLAYNRRETRDKRPLDRESDRSRYHLHTSVKLFWSRPMIPCTSAAV